MADRTQDVIDIIGIAVDYTWALDTKHFELLRDVFTPDATGMLRNVECNGVDEIIARISGGVGRFDATQHLIGNHQVRVDGDTATHRCHVSAQHVLHGAPGGENFVVAGFYDDRFVRMPDGWRIAHRTMQQTWVEGNADIAKR